MNDLINIAMCISKIAINIAMLIAIFEMYIAMIHYEHLPLAVEEDHAFMPGNTTVCRHYLIINLHNYTRPVLSSAFFMSRTTSFGFRS